MIKLTREQVEMMVEEYTDPYASHSLSSLAVKYKVCRTTIKHHLLRAGVKLKATGWRPTLRQYSTPHGRRKLAQRP